MEHSNDLILVLNDLQKRPFLPTQVFLGNSLYRRGFSLSRRSLCIPWSIPAPASELLFDMIIQGDVKPVDVPKVLDLLL